MYDKVKTGHQRVCNAGAGGQPPEYYSCDRQRAVSSLTLTGAGVFPCPSSLLLLVIVCSFYHSCQLWKLFWLWSSSADINLYNGVFKQSYNFLSNGLKDWIVLCCHESTFLYNFLEKNCSWQIFSSNMIMSFISIHSVADIGKQFVIIVQNTDHWPQKVTQWPETLLWLSQLQLSHRSHHGGV